MDMHDALTHANALRQYLTGLYEDVPGDDEIADRHLETACRRADDLVRALNRWQARLTKVGER